MRDTESTIKEKTHQRTRINGRLLFPLRVLFFDKTATKVAKTQVMNKKTDLIVIILWFQYSYKPKSRYTIEMMTLDRTVIIVKTLHPLTRPCSFISPSLLCLQTFCKTHVRNAMANVKVRISKEISMMTDSIFYRSPSSS